jgi:LuxR family maltose regulon positive regulatory protein
MYVGMSEIHRERDDLPAASEYLRKSAALGEHLGLPQNAYRSRVAMARLREAEGDSDGALELLDEADQRYDGDFFPNVCPVPAVRARAWIARGDLGEAATWAHGLSVADDLSYLHEYEHITLARLLLAQHSRERSGPALAEAAGMLGRLLRAAEDGGRTGSVVEVLVLQALADQLRGEVETALVPLARALALAEPEGYVRVFVDEGAPMATLLAAASGIAPRYVQRLRAAFGKVAAKPSPKQALVEPLSERELDVLRLLASELSGPQIARELIVSLNTVRTHTKSIYAKLAVNTRRAAVRRAEELDLLTRRG